jgi:hypothetical protein
MKGKNAEGAIVLRMEYAPPVSVEDAMGKLEAVKAIGAKAETVEKALKRYLEEAIPVGEEREGVRRELVERKVTSWKEVFTTVKERLLPKTRWPEADYIQEEMTKVSEYSTFRRTGE